MPVGIESNDATGAGGADIPDNGPALTAVGQSSASKIASALAPASAQRGLHRRSIRFDDIT